MRKFLSISLILSFFFMLLPKGVKADGMIMPPYNYYIYETQQKALIIYEDNREDLIISISFSGSASDFGWVIPLPNQPDISKVDADLFSKLSTLTKPKKNLLEKIKGEGEGYYYTKPMLESAAPAKDSAEESTVTVVEEDTIGIYDYAILQAEKVDDLKDWMDENEYQLPGSSDEYYPDIFNPTTTTLGSSWSDALPIFQDYIDSDWYFVTIKVNNTFTNSSGATTQLSSGAVSPLRFSFETTDMIYPMKLTGLEKKNIGSTLYVISDHKVKVSNYDNDSCYSSECSYFSTSYAGKIKKSDIEELTKEIGKGSWYSPSGNMRITKLVASSLPYSQMTKEVLVTNADNNKGVNDGTMKFTDWLQLPIVIVIYLPYLALGGIFEVFNMGYYDSSLSGFWVIGALGGIVLTSIIGFILTLLLLPKTRKKIKRIFLYVIQFPSVWIISMILASFVAIPMSLLFAALSIREEVILLDSLSCWTFLVALLPVLFYRLLWIRKRKSE